MNRAFRSLVVKGNVAGDDGRAQNFGRLRQSFYAAAELPESGRLFRIRKVESVGDGGRTRPGTGDIAGGFRNRDHSPYIRVEITIAAIAISFQRDPLPRPSDSQDRRVR